MPNRITGKFAKGGTVYDNLPYPAFADLELMVVERALRLVWQEAPKRIHCHQINFNTAVEKEISSALNLVFDDIWSHDRSHLSELSSYFDPIPVYDNPHGTVDYLGRALEHRPDFAFRRKYTDTGISTINSSLLVEAKLIEAGKTMGKYCGDGLNRFVDGTYAWAMPQAMMMGYVRKTSQKLPDSLAVHFDRLGKREEYRLMEGPVAFTLSRYTNRSYRTLHDRSWNYPGTDRSPGSISVLHLWLLV